MIKLGIIGYPLGHSLSPKMHNAALAHLGIEGNYLALETEPEDLIDRIKYLKIENFKGFNVTIPLKVWITPLLTEVDDYANVAGAVNTVLINDNKDLYGYNTDIYGFINAIPEDMQQNLQEKKAAVFGAGGAARAVATGLASLGIDEITFYARSIEKAYDLETIIQTNFPNININVREHNYYDDLSYASIVVNTTPLGMEGVNEDISPIAASALESLPDDAIVYDLVYKPKMTKLLWQAKRRNLTIIAGLEMLVLQGAKAFEIWTHEKAPVEIMRNAVYKSL